MNAVNLHITANFQDKIAVELAVTATAIFAAVAALSTLPWGFVVERIHVRYVGLAAAGLLFTPSACRDETSETYSASRSLSPCVSPRRTA